MKKIALLIMLAVVMLSALVVPSSSQTIGVDVGDWFVYEGYYWFNMIGSVQIPYQIDDFIPWESELQSINRTVAAINGATVTFEDVISYTNGSTGTNTTVLDTSGTWHVLYIWIVDAAAGPGTQVGYDDSWLQGPVTINDTISFEYETISRDCKRHQTMTGAYAQVNRTYLWDDDTGILVKQIIHVEYPDDGSGSSAGEYVLNLVDTNLWTVPEFPIGTVMLLTFVTITLSIDLFRRKQLKALVL